MHKKERISDGNLEIMDHFWNRGEATISEVLAAVNAKRSKKIKRATIQVQIRRLEKYGWLSHRVEDRTFIYLPTRDGKTARADILQNVRKRVFSGSCLDLVKCLVDGSELSGRELRLIEEFLRSERER